MHAVGEGLAEIGISVAEGEALGRGDDLAPRGQDQDELGAVPAEDGLDRVELTAGWAGAGGGQCRLRVTGKAYEGLLPLIGSDRPELGPKGLRVVCYGPHG
jgi:hypothetical protein